MGKTAEYTTSTQSRSRSRRLELRPDPSKARVDKDDRTRLLQSLRDYVAKFDATYRARPLLFAAWYNAKDEKDICLVEIAKDVLDPLDASWVTFSFVLPPELRPFRKGKLKLTLMGPEEFFDGIENPESAGHKKFRSMKRGIKQGAFVPLYQRPGRKPKEVQKILEAFGLDPER